MSRWVLLWLGCSACATIPGSDVAIPAESHDGWVLAICVPQSRNEACCGYERDSSVLVVCTADAGETWLLMEDDEPAPPAAESFEETL